MKKLAAIAFVALLAFPAVASADIARPKQAAQKLGFEVFQGAMTRGQSFYFHLRAKNGLIVLQSEAYAAKEGAANGVASIRSTGISNATVSKASDGHYYFNVRGNNFKITASSETYASAWNVKRALRSVQTIIDTVNYYKIPVRGL